MKEIKANSSPQMQSSLTSHSELAKIYKEKDTLKQKLRDVEDCYNSLKLEARVIQDKNRSLMTDIRLLNNEIGKENIALQK